MKKLLLATLLLAGISVPVSAQGLYITFEGNPVPNGGVVNYQQSTYEDLSDIIEGCIKWKLDPELYMVSETGGDVTMRVTTDNISLQVCTALKEGEVGKCLTGQNVLEKTPIVLNANQPRNLRIDYFNETYDNITEYTFPEFHVEIEAWYINDPSNVYSITLNMGGNTAYAGVESLAAGQNSVNFNGRELLYDLPGACDLSVYSLSGKTVLNNAVAGAGSLSLEGLSKGIYLYRVSGKYHKAGKIIIK